MLEVSDVYKSYEGAPLLRGISFSVAAGETICLLGASGSGKSTLLRIIAGLETPEHGRLSWDGQDLASVPAHRRGFGLVFQDYALFPHLDVLANVAFGLKMLNLHADQIWARATQVLEKVNLAGFEHRRVTDLSGGEQQRVALARALAPDPRLLMFDEPLGALDRSLRARLMDELRSILHTSGVPAIYVTHDQEEAFSLADRILLLHQGEIVRAGTPAGIWSDPEQAWVARFLDVGNVLEGVQRPDGSVETAAGVFKLDCRHTHPVGQKRSLLIRPGGTRLIGEPASPTSPGPSGSGGDGLEAQAVNRVSGQVSDVIFHQDRFKVVLDSQLYFYLAEAPRIGEQIQLQLPPLALECLS